LQLEKVVTTVKYSTSCLSLLAQNRLFSILQEQVYQSSFYDEILYQQLADYTDKYIHYHQLSSKSVTQYYLNYIREYNQDVRQFEATQQYPLAINANRKAPERVAYDIVLLLSTLLTKHRFRIMQLLNDKSKGGARGLVVGCGSGLELALLADQFQQIVAYDLAMASFLPTFFNKKIQLRKVNFEGRGKQKYDYIYLIEILEHLDNPYQLLAKCQKVLKSNGKIYLTTATNIPQFDHRFNFEEDHRSFENHLKKMGFKVEFSEVIEHEYITKSIQSMNKFYILSQ